MEVGTALPNAWFPYVVLGGSLLVVLTTWAVPLRGLPGAVVQWVRPSRATYRLLLAASAGMSALLGGALAVQTGGPGALVWMWIATLLGMGLVYAETAVSRQTEEGHPVQGLGLVERGLVLLGGIGTLAVGVTTEMLQVQPLTASLGFGNDAWMAGAAIALLCGLGALAIRLPAIARPVFQWGLPLALVTVVAVLLTAAFSDAGKLVLGLEQALDAAFGLRPMAAGGGGAAVALALHIGVLRAISAGNLGLGATAIALEPAPSVPGEAQGLGAMLVPLLTAGLLSTAGAAALLSAPPPEPIASAAPVPLLRNEGRGLRPNPKVGQTIVLPAQTSLETNHQYAMTLWPSPRGHQLGKLFKEDNRVVVPGWALADDASTVIFRSRDRPGQAGWDVRIECTQKTVGSGTRKYIELAPVDPEINFAKVIAFYELDPRPFIATSKVAFDGRVVDATAEDAMGPHRAMYEVEGPDRPFNPKLHELFRMGYRGPFAADTDERTPLAFVAREGFDAPLGSVLPLRLDPDPRGIDIARVHRVGGVESPPWSFLTQVRTLVVRAASDPADDIHIPVRARADGYRIRYESLDPEWTDFRRIASMEGFTGPFVLVPPFEFDVEVRSDARLPGASAGRRALIPLDLPGDVTGPSPSHPLPHPQELLKAGMHGPYLIETGIVPLAHRVDATTGPFGRTLWWTGVILLAWSAMIAWGLIAQQWLSRWAGPRVGAALGTLYPMLAALGSLSTFTLLVAWMDVAIIVAVVPNLLLIVLRLPRLRGPKT